MDIPKATSISKQGYLLVYVSGRGSVPQHRLVIEAVLGRRLNRKEIIHHINGNKADNRPENLMVTSQGEHNKNFHRKLKIPIDELVSLYRSGISAFNLAIKYRTDPRSIRRWLSVYAKEKIRTHTETNKISGENRRMQLDIEAMRFLYGRGYGIKTLAVYFQIPNSTMSNHAKRYGFTRNAEEGIAARNHFRMPTHAALLQEVEHWRNQERSTNP